MSTTNIFHSGAAIRGGAHLLVWISLIPGAAYGQQARDQPAKSVYAADISNVPDAIAKVKSGEFALVHVELIANAGAVEAIPILKDQFVRSQDPLAKAKIADALVRLGEKDDAYWEFLEKGATDALETDAPSPLRFDSIPGPSPEFTEWARSRHITTESALEALYESAMNVAFLAEAGDPRGIPLLRRALSSHYFLIQVSAAKGLAELRDKASIPLIIDACERAPAESASAIARSLVYFDDPQAQMAVDRYIPKDMAKLFREGRAGGENPFGERPLHQ